MELNDRLEYETLWRHPIEDDIMNVVGERDELAISGHFIFFNNFEKIHNDMNHQRSEFESVRDDFLRSHVDRPKK